MKPYTKNSVSKLVDRFDNELKAIIMNDLKAIRAAKNHILNSINPGLNQDSLTAA
jgi:hypothetical protein